MGTNFGAYWTLTDPKGWYVDLVAMGILQHQVRPAIEAFLKERGLELSDEKTHTTHISQGFDFLG